MEISMLFSLAGYFLVMLAIGMYACQQSTDDIAGYILGGRRLSPAVTALSAGASDMSGWMLLGLPGAMYLSGLSSIWIAVGLLFGALLNYMIVAPRLRVYTEVANNSLTIPDFFENRFSDPSRTLRLVSSLVIVVFFTLYTSSGVVAGGKLFESAFHLDYEVGLYITCGVVVLYTLFGGFLAVSLTDFVQGCIMLVALIIVPFVALDVVGGLDNMHNTIMTVNPNYFSLFNNVSLLGLISALAWGLGYFGQPHIIVRFMAIRSVTDLPLARRIGMTWMFISLLGAMATGFVGIAYIVKTGGHLADAETIFILLSQVLFHPLVAGFLLAAILAAIMSTLSSQLLVTSSSLTEDFYHVFFNKQATEKRLVLVSRLAVFFVAMLAVYFAHDRHSSILDLVSNAWAGFGAAFGPVIILSLYWKNMNKYGALAGMLTGAFTVLFWIYAPIQVNGQSLSAMLYEIVPGFILATIAIVLVSSFTGGANEKLKLTFDEVSNSFK